MITEKEVKQLVESFWHDVRSGRPGSEMEHYFIGQGRVMVPGGVRMDLEPHQEMHRQLCDEVHAWKTIEIKPVWEDPERVHVAALASWDASFVDGRPGRIKTQVQEEWVIERCEDGQVRFVLYRSPVVDFADDSAELII